MPFTKQSVNDVVFHTANPFTEAGGVAHGFAARLGGVSAPPWDSLNISLSRGDDPAAVRENYHRMCAALGTDVNKLVMTHQVHEDYIRPVGPGDILPDTCLL